MLQGREGGAVCLLCIFTVGVSRARREKSGPFNFPWSGVVCRFGTIEMGGFVLLQR